MDFSFNPAPLWLTLKVAGISTLLAFVTGVPLAFVVARKRFWGRELLDSLATLPLVLPPTVLGYYLIVFIGRRGPLGHWLEDTLGLTLIFTWQGAVLAAAVVSLPLVFKSARAAFEEVPRNLENVGRTLGLNEAAIFAALDKNKVRVAAEVTEYRPILYPMALVAGSRQPEAARGFMDYVLSPQGRAVLARYGFGAP